MHLALLAFVYLHYTRVPIAQYAGYHVTHVCSQGYVTEVSKAPEPDGDTWFRLSERPDGGAFITCEISPFHRLDLPRLGQRVESCGIRRFDDAEEEQEWEQHPVDRLTVMEPGQEGRR
jgi:hypothetical protein